MAPLSCQAGLLRLVAGFAWGHLSGKLSASSPVGYMKSSALDACEVEHHRDAPANTAASSVPESALVAISAWGQDDEAAAAAAMAGMEAPAVAMAACSPMIVVDAVTAVTAL